MIEVKSNYKNLYKDNLSCNLCKDQNDTTGHLLTCQFINKEKHELSEKDIINANKKVASAIVSSMKEREKNGFILSIKKVE